MDTALEHDYDRGWRRYGFDNMVFSERCIHGADVLVRARNAFNRGLWKPHISFLVVPPSDTWSIGLHVHRDVPTGTDVEEWYIVIDGEGLMTFSNGDTVDVGAGDLIATYPGTGHALRVTGDGPLRLVSICPLMFTMAGAAQVAEVPDKFTPRIQIGAVDATLNPVDAACADCDSSWQRPSWDRAATTLPIWAREHDCPGATVIGGR